MRVFNKKAAAVYCGVKPYTLEKWDKAGLLKNVGKPHSPRYTEIDLDGILEMRRGRQRLRRGCLSGITRSSE